MKRIVKSIMARTPYRVVRDRGANRFQAIEAAMCGMRDRGFAPGLVIDGGAHLGDFSLMAKKIFPGAHFHLVEPQAACIPPLRSLCAREGFVLHACALAEVDGELSLVQSATPSTGAHVASASDGAPKVRAATLDALLADVIAAERRTLLKLDLQGYELHALRGAKRSLPAIEAILTEASFFAQAYEPPIATLVAFMEASGFQLYDVAALAGRARDNRLFQGDLVFVSKTSRLLEDTRWD